MKPILHTLIFALCPFLLFGSDPYPLNPAIDVQHYAFRLRLSAETNNIVGKTAIEVLLKQDVETFALDLQNETAAGGMKIVTLQVNGQQTAFRHTDSKINIDASGKAGEMLKVVIEYEGVPLDGLIIGTNLFGEKTFFGDNWPDRAHQWLPTVDHPSDKATCEFIIEAPVYYQVVANGRLKEETVLSNDTKLTHWIESVPISTKVMVFGAAAFAIDHVGSVGNIPVSSWVYHQNKNAGFHDYAPAKEILATLQNIIGPYPFEKLANVQSKTKFGGMENAGNIFYYEKSVSGERKIEGLIAHEVAHQWFGNSASEKDWHHVWLSEGFATYFTQVYMEKTYGRDSLQVGMKRMLPKIDEYHAKNPTSAIVDTSIIELKKLLSPNTYQKAGWVLHMLRKQVGDEAFFDGVRTYYDTYKLSNALTSDFQAVMEQASGQQLGWFFDQWIFQPLLPELSLSWKYSKKLRKLSVEVKSPGLSKSVRLPLEVGIQGADGTISAIKIIDVFGESTSAEWDIAEMPAGIIADPNVWLLAKVKVVGK
ncbi:M1 family metallopeptidase [Imperialibacter roseus]|uniref:Aminopeptidase N n=1 Tax=Imperialibacter roseus TaxID=1324217 RepID=A0ABZ0ISP5_9BACT|nr:M1 family metallopeptidase [Imperialibacter roseus]WOK08068.1 M1 family metallopeptidase [Imperialibacter roseus]